MQHAKINLALVSMAVLTLAACGGGDSDSPPPVTSETAEGLWVGTTNTNRSITGLLLDDGTYYVLHSLVADPSIIGGVVQGHGTSINGSFSSTDARDFNIEGLGVLPATVSASYMARQSFNGTVMYTSGDAVSFTTTYDSQYDLTPSLATLAGTFTGQVAFSQGVQNATVTVSDTGAISGVGEGGCTFTGTAAPRASGNVFNMSITFGGAPCFFAGQTLTGIAYYDPDPTDKRLYAAAPNATRTDGVLFVGVKP